LTYQARVTAIFPPAQWPELGTRIGERPPLWIEAVRV